MSVGSGLEAVAPPRCQQDGEGRYTAATADAVYSSVAHPHAEPSADASRFEDFGIVVFDLETVHDAEKGTYLEKGMHECSAAEQIAWKRRSQIIEFAGIDLRTGARLQVKCRPDFRWSDVVSPAARQFAEDHGHDRIVQDESLGKFSQCWLSEVAPFLTRSAGVSRQLAMVAHNGDAFDHFVLEKELQRLGLTGSLAVEVHRFDPIRTLKNNFGPDFGAGGQLSLRSLHKEHVPANSAQTHEAHRALGDCIKLLEVLCSWHELSVLLAKEIAVSVTTSTMEAASVFTRMLSQFVASPALRRRLSSSDRVQVGQGESSLSADAAASQSSGAVLNQTSVPGLNQGYAAYYTTAAQHGAPPPPSLFGALPLPTPHLQEWDARSLLMWRMQPLGTLAPLWYPPQVVPMLQTQPPPMPLPTTANAEIASDTASHHDDVANGGASPQLQRRRGGRRRARNRRGHDEEEQGRLSGEQHEGATLGDESRGDVAVDTYSRGRRWPRSGGSSALPPSFQYQ